MCVSNSLTLTVSPLDDARPHLVFWIAALKLNRHDLAADQIKQRTVAHINTHVNTHTGRHKHTDRRWDDLWAQVDFQREIDVC